MPDQKYDRLIEAVVNSLPKWTPKWLSLFSTVVARSPVEVIWLAGRIAKSDGVTATLLLKEQLDRELEEARTAALADKGDDSETSLARYAKRALRQSR